MLQPKHCSEILIPRLVRNQANFLFPEFFDGCKQEAVAIKLIELLHFFISSLEFITREIGVSLTNGLENVLLLFFVANLRANFAKHSINKSRQQMPSHCCCGWFVAYRIIIPF